MEPKNNQARSPEAPMAGSVSDAAARSGSTLRRAAAVAVALIVVGVLVGVVPRMRGRASLRDETRRLVLQTVAVVSPAPGKSAAGLLLPAEIKPLVEAPIYARASGYLKRYLVDIGAVVKEGELLAEIDAPELNQELAQARAQRAQAEAALALAHTTADRWAELLKSASVSEQESAEKQADLQLKTANVQAAEANVRRLEDLQSFEMVKAPFGGTITMRSIDVGQLISAGSGRELFRLAQTGTLRVYVRVPEAGARGIRIGQLADLTIPEIPGRVFPARIVRTSGAMSSDSRTLLTELEVNNSHGEILAGTYGQVRFIESATEIGLTLPANTLLFRAEGPQVGVVLEDGRVDLRRVTLGRDYGPTVEIVEGVGRQDKVILNPPDSLVSGVTVRLAQATAPDTQKVQAESQGQHP